jgi:hypothetical protein
MRDRAGLLVGIYIVVVAASLFLVRERLGQIDLVIVRLCRETKLYPVRNFERIGIIKATDNFKHQGPVQNVILHGLCESGLAELFGSGDWFHQWNCFAMDLLRENRAHSHFFSRILTLRSWGFVFNDATGRNTDGPTNGLRNTLANVGNLDSYLNGSFSLKVKRLLPADPLLIRDILIIGRWSTLNCLAVSFRAFLESSVCLLAKLVASITCSQFS